MRKRRKLWIGLAGGALVAGSVGYALATGDISPNKIEIDLIANLYDNSAGTGTAGVNNGNVDWVATTTGNTGTNCRANPPVVTCNCDGTPACGYITAVSGGQGTWNGVRIVDGFSQDDEDIFLTGGKVYDTSTWNIGPGTIGSSKYDFTQAYLANSENFLFFGMERFGNNGTTAFDFEFNGCTPLDAYTPNRMDGDVLFTYLIHGSGGSGTAEPFVYQWVDSDQVDCDTNGPIEGTFVQLDPLPSGFYATRNETTVAAPPWGTVDNGDGWTLANIARFQFAEAQAPIGAGGVPLNLNATDCSASAWVQVRTRSSETEKSDAKDTSPIFEYVFAGLQVTAAKVSANATNLTAQVDATVSGGTPTGYQWQVFDDKDTASTADDEWVNITGATSASLTFPVSTFTFETYGTKSANTSVTLSGVTYYGYTLDAQVRVVITGTASGGSCQLASSAVTIKKLLAVDP